MWAVAVCGLNQWASQASKKSHITTYVMITRSFIPTMIYNKAETTKNSHTVAESIQLHIRFFHHKTGEQHLSGEVHKANIACNKQLYDLQHSQAS